MTIIEIKEKIEILRNQNNNLEKTLKLINMVLFELLFV